MIVALVLAGGRSRRLGTEKAMASFKGEPLLFHAVSHLREQGFSVAINAPMTSGAAAWSRTHGYPLLPDDARDPAGPLAGVKAGLLWAAQQGAEILVTTPCDTPQLPKTLELTLSASFTPAADAAVARSPSGLQSLCAAWRVGPTLCALEGHFEDGVHPAVHDLLAQLSAAEVLCPDDAEFANFNTWADFAQGEGEAP